MTPAVLPTPRTPQPPTAPLPVRWTAADFYQMSGLPSMRDRRVILIDGEILEMAAPSPLHDISLALTAEWLRTPFPPTQFVIRNQSGLYFGINTDPVPDLVVVAGMPRSFGQHPRTALLVVEVADSSLGFDLGEKASLYAAAGISDYWVIDVNDRKIHVLRDPQPDPTTKYGASYGIARVLTNTDLVSPLSAPGCTVEARDLLP